jgi:hypothetical protein
LEQVFQLEREVWEHPSGTARREVMFGLTSLRHPNRATPDIGFGPPPRIMAILNNLVLELLLTNGLPNVP